MFLRDSQELIHHCGELSHPDDTILVSVVVSEDLQHVPVQLHMLRTGGCGNGSLDEGLVLLHTALVNDGVGIHCSGLGSNVLLAKLQPLVKGDDTAGLEVHGVEHLLPGHLLLSLSLIKGPSQDRN